MQIGCARIVHAGRLLACATLRAMRIGFHVMMPFMAACGFNLASPSGVQDARIDSSLIDAVDVDAPVLADAPADVPGTMLCPWPYAPAYVDPCTSTPGGLVDLDLALNGTYTYDSGGSILVPPSGPAIPVITTQPGGAGTLRIIWVHVLRVQTGTTLRLIGGAPVVIVATSEILIDGTVDASSRGTSSLANNGAGSNPASCTATVAGNGAQCMHGGSAGGGGGFGTFGGNGGSGGVSHNCVVNQNGEGISGGAGGPAALTLPPPVVRGGCNGGNGAQGDGPAPGNGGRGGGAIALVARDRVRVSATGQVHAGGAGGRGANNGRSSGGGGGSGGMVFLSGDMVTIEAGGVLAANGGGGGGGADGGAATAGDDAVAASQVASGGPKDSNGGDGGAGAFATTAAQGGSSADRGGGGGGGGAGVIRLQTGSTLATTGGAVITPPVSP